MSKDFAEYWLPLALVVATTGTTYWAGCLQAEGFLAGLGRAYEVREVYIGGLGYCLPLMAILVTHEMGHYLTARRLGVKASLPFLIPLPAAFFMLGTLGAVIRLREIPHDRSTLLKVGAAGPLAGGVVAFAVMIFGIATSAPVPNVIPDSAIGDGTVMVMGDSLAMALLTRLLWPDLAAAGQTLWASPMFMAGWAGFLVTMLNLIPMGQLDGGHISYAVFGKIINRLWWVIVAVLGFLAVFKFVGYGLWAVLGVFLGRWHFPVPDEQSPLDGVSRWMAVACLILFVLTFIPAPIHASLLDIVEMARTELASAGG